MSSFEVRPFRRGDRDQLTGLVNRHAAAVIPGTSVSTNTVLSQLECEPGEFIVDTWVAERQTLVAEQGGAIVAAALLLRYRADADVGDAYRNAGEIRWLVFWPMAPTGNPFWRDAADAADAVIVACLLQFDAWQVTRRHADGALPSPGVYGVPGQWPHIEQLYRRHGFTPYGPVEMVFMADLDSIDNPGSPPVDGLGVRRLVGINGTRFAAHLDDKLVAFVEVDRLDHPERHIRSGGLADIGNLHVDDTYRRQGIACWLVQHAAQWLRLGHADRLLAYARPDETEMINFLTRNRFIEITRTRRGWAQDQATVSEPAR
jgi:GNAT superfamily N-acetyltransferase